MRDEEISTNGQCQQGEPRRQTERLRQVIARADVIMRDGVWCFEEFPVDQPPALTSNTLAVVRDDQRWTASRTVTPSPA